MRRQPLRISRTTVSGSLALVLTAAPAAAQDAAETAVILSGTAQAQGAGRDLGNAISGAMGRVGDALSSGGNAGSATQGSSSTRTSNTTAIPAGGDALEGTDAQAYRTSTGATIRVSGRLQPNAGTVCVENCDRGAAAD